MAALTSLAPLDARLSAYIIDGLLFFPIGFALFLPSFIDLDVLRAWMLWALSWHLYWAFFWSRLGHGQTLGMRVRRIRVVREDGRDVEVRRAVVRAIALFFGSVIAVVPLSILLSRDGVGIHDRLAGTRVIRLTP